MHTPPRPMTTPAVPPAVMALWRKKRTPEPKAKPESPATVPREPGRQRAEARFVLLQYALHDDGSLRETLQNLTKNGDTNRADLVLMLSKARQTTETKTYAAPVTKLTRTGQYPDVDRDITNLYALLAKQQEPEERGDVLIVTLAATLAERHSPPSDLENLMDRLSEDELLRAQICWSPARGPMFTRDHAQMELAALAAHFQE